MSAVVVDTNVILVANGQHADISPECIAACSLKLKEIMDNGTLVIDDNFRILNEYLNKTTPKTSNRPGDRFVKWALQNNANKNKIESVELVEDATRSFESFPNDIALNSFDPPDRKFVAVAASHKEKPPILQAADCKWLDWEESLRHHGINIKFVCPEDVRKFHRKKFGK